LGSQVFSLVQRRTSTINDIYKTSIQVEKASLTYFLNEKELLDKVTVVWWMGAVIEFINE